MNRRGFLSFLGLGAVAAGSVVPAVAEKAPVASFSRGAILRFASHYETVPSGQGLDTHTLTMADFSDHSHSFGGDTTKAVIAHKEMIFDGQKWVNLESEEGRRVVSENPVPAKT